MSNVTGGNSPDLTLSPLDDVPLDTVYSLLQNQRRRLVLYYLLDAPEHESSIGEMASQIAAWENDKAIAGVTSKERKRTYNTLQQTHLSKLADAGIVRYDRRSGRVKLCSDPKRLKLFLSYLPKTGSKSFFYTLGVETLLVFSLAINWLGVHVAHVFSPKNGMLVTAVVTVVILVTHFYVLSQFR